jgi:hypothetical protein
MGPLTEMAARRRHPLLPFGHAGRPAPAPDGVELTGVDTGKPVGVGGEGQQHLAPRAPVEGEDGPHWHRVAQADGTFRGGHAHPAVAVTHEELGALARLVPQPGEHGAGHLHQVGLAAGHARPTQQAQPQAVATLPVPPHQAVGLQGGGQAVGGGPGHPGGLHQAGQRQWPPFGQDGENAHRLVENADTAYTVHIAIFSSHDVRRKKEGRNGPDAVGKGMGEPRRPPPGG